MDSHAYVSHLKNLGSSLHLKPCSSSVKKAKWLVKGSIKRLLPKRRETKKVVVEEIPLPQSIPHQPKKATKKKKPAYINGGEQHVSPKQQESSKESQTWQSCKLKIKIPLVRIDSNTAKTPDKSFAAPQVTPKLLLPNPNKQLKRKRSPASDKPKSKKAKLIPNQGQSPSFNKKATVEESLTCPTCDKVFMAKSILERHLKKSKHGVFEGDKDVMPPPPFISQALDKAMAEGRQLPHLNQVLQPQIEVGGRTVNKYECHLCKQVFLRVKDLAKHRERMMCSAWH